MLVIGFAGAVFAVCEGGRVALAGGAADAAVGRAQTDGAARSACLIAMRRPADF